MKHRVFAWLMLVDRINTRDMLRRRKFNIGTVFTCLLCDSGCDETRNHLFFECAFGTSCWDRLGIHWDINLPVEGMSERARRDSQGALFTEAVILGAWNIWKIRNRKLFDHVQPEVPTGRRLLARDLDILGCRVKEKHKDPLKQIYCRISL